MIRLSRVPPMLPGQYTKRSTGTVALACPCCAFVTVLDWPYRVGASGVVAPKWLCAVCNWSGDVQLVDYAEAVVG